MPNYGWPEKTILAGMEKRHMESGTLTTENDHLRELVKLLTDEVTYLKGKLRDAEMSLFFAKANEKGN